MKKLVWLLLLSVVLSACGSSTTSTSSAGPSMASVASKVSAVKSATAVPTAEQQTIVLQLIQVMFNASPGATYLDAFAGYLAGGMSPETLADLFASTDLFKIPSLYPDSLSNQQFAEKFINNLVGSTVSDTNRNWAIGWFADMLNGGTTKGKAIWTAVSALASVPTSNPDWGAAVTQLNNKVAVSYYYAVTKAVSSTDLATLQAVTASVTNNSSTVTAAKAGIDSASLISKVGWAVQLPQTGQTTSYAAGDDGALQKGTAWPNPRFTDNANGTVTDNLTGLIWLKNANCFGAPQTWAAALTSANGLSSPACGLTDGSSAGQWRLPNIAELESLVDAEHVNPALPTGHPFTGVQLYFYWSSSTYAGKTIYAWSVFLTNGYVSSYDKSMSGCVWPVRAGQ